VHPCKAYSRGEDSERFEEMQRVVADAVYTLAKAKIVTVLTITTIIVASLKHFALILIPLAVYLYSTDITENLLGVLRSSMYLL